ncbi:hypothetical protein [Sphingobium agri]|uniref:hypothetical protein n=1 Tax=Sphingobium agri TaxID=2933566 RepID=UPI001FF6E04B|nr:hypothetical protein [Sphingobium agri]
MEGVSSVSPATIIALLRKLSSGKPIGFFAQIHTFLMSGDLISGGEGNEFYRSSWSLARADSFDLAKTAA